MARALSPASSHGVSSNQFGFFSPSNLWSSPSSSSSLRTMRRFSIKMVQNQTYWGNIEADIETHLKKAIPIRDPVSVFEPMHYLTFTAPRTTAPALCIAACELIGGDRDQAMAAAAAIHLIHAASYAHQHLPLTDRPRPDPIDHKFNPNIELLTGDGIIPFGFELLSDSINLPHNKPERVLRVIIEVTRAAGSLGVVEGQYKEMDIADQQPEDGADNAGLIEYVCKKKEGELHGCAAACGAILGGGSEEEIEKLRRYGVYAGMIQGMLMRGVGRRTNHQTAFGLKSRVEKWRDLAMKELEGFNANNRGGVDGILAWFESEIIDHVH